MFEQEAEAFVAFAGGVGGEAEEGADVLPALAGPAQLPNLVVFRASQAADGGFDFGGAGEYAGGRVGTGGVELLRLGANGEG